MKRLVILMLAVVLCIAGCGCEGVVLDENEVIEGNGTNTVIKSGVTYTNDGKQVKCGEEVLYSIDDMKSDSLFALGQFLYVNTQRGAMQLKLDGTKQTKFGSGEIVAAKGKWVYYQSEDNQQKTMTVYKIDMVGGKQLMLFADTMLEVKEIENNVFYFRGVSGNEYINELHNDNGLFYHEWLGEDVTE